MPLVDIQLIEGVFDDEQYDEEVPKPWSPSRARPCAPEELDSGAWGRRP